MHDPETLTAFIVLRGNGWSIAKISRHLNVPKSTIWDWDCKQAGSVQFVKHLQLEKLQEKFIPTYENELQQLTDYLNRVEKALQDQDFSKMTPEFLLQTSLHIRTRLNKMREQLPLRTTPGDQPAPPLPFTGCVSSGDVISAAREDFRLDSQSARSPEPVATTGTANPESDVRASSTSTSHPPVDGKPHLNGGGHPGGNGHTTRNGSPSEKIRVDPCSSVVNPSPQNRTFPDKTTPGSISGHSDSTT